MARAHRGNADGMASARRAPRPPHVAAGRFLLRALAAATGLVLVAVPFGLLLLLVEDRWRPLLRVDDGARDDLHGYAVRHAGFVDVLKGLSTAGSALVYVPLFTLLALWLLRRGRPRIAAFVAVSELGSWGLNAAVKHAVHRARPILDHPVAHAAGLSFPSGHAQSATVAVLVLGLVLAPILHGATRAAAVALGIAWVLAIGFARVALGVHYVSDVLAGIALGAAWVAATTAAFGAWRRERGLGERRDVSRDGLEPGHGAALAGRG